MSKIKLSSEHINQSEQKLRLKFQAFEAGKPRLDAIFSEVGLQSIDSQLNALDVYFHVILALENGNACQGLSEADCVKLRDLGERCLRICSIQPITSMHSHLYMRLYQNLAVCRTQAGQVWQGITQIMLGEYFSREHGETNHELAFLRGMQAWKLGHLRIAKIALHSMDSGAAAHQEEALRLLVRIYRLSGDSENAQLLLANYRERASPAEADKVQLESILCALQSGSDPLELADFLAKSRNRLERPDLELGKLWLCASRYRDIWLSLSSSSKDKPKKSAAGGKNAFHPISVLESLYDDKEAVNVKIENIGKAIAHLQTIGDPEHSLLFLAGCIRALIRHKQTAFAGILFEEYKGLSLRYSEGKSFDSLNMIQSITESLPLAINRQALRSEAHLYTGFAPRFLKIAQVVAKCSFEFAKLKMSGSMSVSEFRERRAQINLKMLRNLQEGVGQLKGPLMKLGQMIATSHLLNEEALAVAGDIHHFAPSVPFEIFKVKAEADLGRPLSSIFKHLDENPIAVASIGQVYRAKLLDGTDVAVKFIYPDIDAIVKTDMQLAKLLMPLMRSFLPEVNLNEVFELFKQRFIQECNYEVEAQNQADIYQLLLDDQDIKIPKVFKEYCSKTMLVTEFIHGIRLDNFRHQATQEQKDAACRQAMKFMVFMTIKHGIIHMDPHLANGAMCGDRYTVFDFGSIFHMPQDMHEGLKKVTIARYLGNFLDCYEALVELGVIDPKTMPFDAFKLGLGEKILSPYCKDETRFLLDEAQCSLNEYLMQKENSKLLSIQAKHVMFLTVLAMHEEFYALIPGHINWHRTLGELLMDAGLIDKAVHLQPVPQAL